MKQKGKNLVMRTDIHVQRLALRRPVGVRAAAEPVDEEPVRELSIAHVEVDVLQQEQGRRACGLAVPLCHSPGAEQAKVHLSPRILLRLSPQ